MLIGWRRTALVVLGIAALFFAASFLFPPTSELCSYNYSADAEDCAKHHLGPFVVFWLGSEVDGHAGFVTAIATIFIAYFTLTLKESSDRLAGISDEQTKLVEAQKEIGRAQHLADHRPRLRVRHVALSSNETMLNYGDPIKGGLAVVNVGATKAEIVDSFYCIYIGGSVLPMRSPLDVKRQPLIHLRKRFEIGESCAIPIGGIVETDTKPKGTFLILESRDTSPTGQRVYVMGQIQYRDEGGSERFMGFCRQWTGDGTFSAVSNPDYEYED